MARVTEAWPRRSRTQESRAENFATHLQSPDFFDAERYPELGFESNEIERAGDRITVRGGITIKGVDKPVELTGTLVEPITDPYGRERISLKLETTVDRTDFGVNWNVPLPDGNPALANEVKLEAEQIGRASCRERV